MFVALASLSHTYGTQDALEKLADDFWNWRAHYAPFTGDDVNRIERPGGTRDWSSAAIDRHRKELVEFEARWKKIDASGWPIPKQVDYRLIGSALARVRWELDINQRWKRDPLFYIKEIIRQTDPLQTEQLLPDRSDLFLEWCIRRNEVGF